MGRPDQCTVETRCSGCALRQRSDAVPLTCALDELLQWFRHEHDANSPLCKQPGLPERGRLTFTITPH